MSLVVYNIFYPIKSFSEPECLSHISGWMLDSARLSYISRRFPPAEPDPAPKIPVLVETPINLESEIFPKQEDTLFWCGFIAENGYAEFLAVDRKHKNKEMEDKQAILSISNDVFRKTNYKLTGVAISEIRSDLMTNSKTTLTTFIAICCFFHIRVLVVDKLSNTYLEYIPDPDILVSHIIFHHPGGKFSIDTESTPHKVAEIVASSVKLDSCAKHFGSISSYTIQALKDIAEKLNLPTKTLKKSDIYVMICEKCTWK